MLLTHNLLHLWVVFNALVKIDWKLALENLRWLGRWFGTAACSEGVASLCYHGTNPVSCNSNLHSAEFRQVIYHIDSQNVNARKSLKDWQLIALIWGMGRLRTDKVRETFLCWEGYKVAIPDFNRSLLTLVEILQKLYCSDSKN